MRSVGILSMLLLAAIASGADPPPQASGTLAIDDLPKVSSTLGGKQLKFPEKGIADGVKATVGLLESCCDESLYEAAELQKAEQGDHIRLAFPKPITVTVMHKKVEISELVFRRPLNTGVFWVRSQDKWRRYSKYEFQKQKPFMAWLSPVRVPCAFCTPLAQLGVVAHVDSRHTRHFGLAVHRTAHAHASVALVNASSPR